jgi:hypothetical protein
MACADQSLILGEYAIGVDLIEEPGVELVACGSGEILRFVTGMEDMSSESSTLTPFRRCHRFGHEETDLSVLVSRARRDVGSACAWQLGPNVGPRTSYQGGALNRSRPTFTRWGNPVDHPRMPNHDALVGALTDCVDVGWPRSVIPA